MPNDKALRDEKDDSDWEESKRFYRELAESEMRSWDSMKERLSGGWGWQVSGH